jgi:LysR family transcriptional regulator, low CO2-responsive transcriptional regulator
MIERTTITFHQLQTFLAVARSGSFTKVARELNATQPTISLQLGALRKSFGMALFERPGGRFRLTPAGERLQRYAEAALEALRELQQDMAVLKGSLTGSLAVGVTYLVAGHLSPTLFRAQFPDVAVQVHVDLPEPLFQRVLNNTLDVACFLRVRTPPELILEPLGEEEFVIIASPHHRLAGRRSVSAVELSQEPLVVSGVTVFRELVEAKLRAAGVTPRVVIAEARNYDAVKELVERNKGYSLHLKPLAAPEIAAGRFVALQLNGPPIVGEIVAATRPRTLASPLVQEFIRFLRAELSRPATGKPNTSARPRRGRPLRPRRTRRRAS